MLCVQLRCVSFISRAILISFVGPIVAQMVITFHLYREKNRPNYRAHRFVMNTLQDVMSYHPYNYWKEKCNHGIPICQECKGMSKLHAITPSPPFHLNI